MSERMGTMDFTDRWIRLVKQAESPQALDWIKRQIERKRAGTPELNQLVAQREREITEGRHDLPF